MYVAGVGGVGEWLQGSAGTSYASCDITGAAWSTCASHEGGWPQHVLVAMEKGKREQKRLSAFFNFLFASCLLSC